MKAFVEAKKGQEYETLFSLSFAFLQQQRLDGFACNPIAILILLAVLRRNAL